MKNILIYGLGNFGFALLKYLDDINDDRYFLSGFDRKRETINSLRKNREHNLFHKGHFISKNVSFYNNNIQAIENVDVLILAVSSDAIIEVISNIQKYFKKGIIILNTAKALSRNGNTYSQELSNILKGQIYHYGMISGGTIAKDLFMGYPLGATMSFYDRNIGEEMKKIFTGGDLEIELNTDVLGTEYAGAFKNIGSILAGYIYGKGLPYGTETYYLTKFLKEIKQLSVKYLGVKTETFSIDSQCWGNDYWMSCTGETRNREFGILLGKGVKFENAKEIMKLQNKTIEGINTLMVLDGMFRKYKINRKDFPLLSKLLDIIDNTFSL